MEPSAFFYVPPHPPLSPILGERIKVRGYELSIRRSIIYTNINNYRDAMKREKYLKTTWGKRYIKNRIKFYLEETNKCT